MAFAFKETFHSFMTSLVSFSQSQSILLGPLRVLRLTGSISGSPVAGVAENANKLIRSETILRTKVRRIIPGEISSWGFQDTLAGVAALG